MWAWERKRGPVVRRAGAQNDCGTVSRRRNAENRLLRDKLPDLGRRGRCQFRLSNCGKSKEAGSGEGTGVRL